MKTVGIVGGLAWPSTVDYYSGICKRSNEYFRKRGALAPFPVPHMIIDSLDISKVRALRGRDDDASWRGFESEIRASLLRLKSAGADFGVIASNTPHMRIAGISDGLDFPIVSILDATAMAVSKAGGKRALVLGTSVTMRSSAYRSALENVGVEVLPNLGDEDIEALDSVIDVDLCQGRVDGVCERILELCRPVVTNESDLVCLACTDLPQAFSGFEDVAVFSIDGIRFVNASVAHLDAIFEAAVEDHMSCIVGVGT